MAKIINLTLARQLETRWNELHKLNPYSQDFRHRLEQLIEIPDFKKRIENLIPEQLSVDNVDLVCYLLEEYWPELKSLLSTKRKQFYLSSRIENCIHYIEKKPILNYDYGFPKLTINPDDSRANFLLSVLIYVDVLDKDHQTVLELWDTPIEQYEQMIQFISFFPHEKIPVLLEKLSYVDREDFIKLTVKPIGFFKSKTALDCLRNLETYLKKTSPQKLPLIYQTMQKLAFHLPRIK